MRYIAAVLASAFLMGCGSGEEKAPAAEQESILIPRQASAPAAAPAAPQHIYAMKDGQTYGYEAALSEEDKAKGLAAKPLMMFAYAGSKEGKHQVFVLDTDAITVFECGEPCEFLKIMVFTVNGEHVKTERLRAEPNMIAAQALQDAKNGFLERAGLGESKADVKWVWFTEKGIQFTVPKPEERSQ